MNNEEIKNAIETLDNSIELIGTDEQESIDLLTGNLMIVKEVLASVTNYISEVLETNNLLVEKNQSLQLANSRLFRQVHAQAEATDRAKEELELTDHIARIFN